MCAGLIGEMAEMALNSSRNLLVKNSSLLIGAAAAAGGLWYAFETRQTRLLQREVFEWSTCRSEDDFKKFYEKYPSSLTHPKK